MLKLNDFYFTVTEEFIEGNTNTNLCPGEILTKEQYNEWNSLHPNYASFSELLYRGLMALISEDEEFESLIDNFNYFDFKADDIIEFYHNFPHEHSISFN